MNTQNQLSQKTAGLVKAMCGGLLIGLPAIPLAALAEAPRRVTSCPGIYYEEPFNSTHLPPEGCPANARSIRLGIGGPTTPDAYNPPAVPAPTTGGGVIAPLPETQREVIATVTPQNQQVSVRLKNNTNALIFYRAVGHTGDKPLRGGEEAVLRGLPLPVTVMTTRVDDGFVEVASVSTDSGMLEVALDEDANLDGNRSTLRIQEDGQVFLY